MSPRTFVVANLALATGVIWLALALLRLTGPSYWSPSSPVDYASVVLFSAATITLGLCLLRIGTLLHGAAQLAARASAIGLIVNGTANLLEDGFLIREFGALWILSAFALIFALPVLSAILAGSPESRVLAVAVALTVVGLLFIGSFGFFLIGGVWLALGTVLRRRLSEVGRSMPIRGPHHQATIS